MAEHSCRSCRSASGQVVVDLGEQPAADHFPPAATRGPDDLYPLEMWLCRSCGLAQLVADPTVPEEVLGVEPAALRAQAARAVTGIEEDGWLSGRRTVTEFPTPHGGSWLGLLEDRGLQPTAGEPADVVIDTFGLMHCRDQAAALAERSRSLADDGVLLIQYHPLSTIIRLGQWNALRHGHFAYYSTTALLRMLEGAGLSGSRTWTFDLYGGTVLLAATRAPGPPAGPHHSIAALTAEDDETGVTEPARVGRLQEDARTKAAALRSWLAGAAECGGRVVGYGAASRAVPLLVQAGVDRNLLPAIVDASPAKHGRRMPGTDIPVVGPSRLREGGPRTVLLFVPDLMDEVREAYPEVEAAGGCWVSAEELPTGPV